MKKQRGAVLAISLVILLVLTLLVVSGNQQVVLQEKMTAAVRDSHLSMESAEFALYEGAAIVEALTGTAGFSDTGNGGYYKLDQGPADLFASGNWVDGKTISGSLTVAGQTIDYRYYIEELGIIPVPDEDLAGVNMMGYGQTTGGGNVTAFKIVARALGMSGSAERLVVAYYGKRL